MNTILSSEQSTSRPRVLITGSSGFLGHHLARYLKKKGYWIRGADIKEPEYSSLLDVDEFKLLDLRRSQDCLQATESIDHVYTFAANMGGIEYITMVRADIVRDNILINTHLAEACRINKIQKLFFASSACVYPTHHQESSDVVGLKEDSVYPANPDNEYGWEKLFSERLYTSYRLDYGLEVRIARFHNIFGPEGPYDGGREKAPAAVCRKIASSPDGGAIEVWGDGRQTRSFCYVDDCLEGIYRLMMSNYQEPINIGSDRLVTINELFDIVATIADKKIEKKYLPDKPQGVRGRNSDNTLCKEVLGWEPSIPLEDGLKKTYEWVAGMLTMPPHEIKSPSLSLSN